MTERAEDTPKEEDDNNDEQDKTQPQEPASDDPAVEREQPEEEPVAPQEWQDVGDNTGTIQYELKSTYAVDDKTRKNIHAKLRAYESRRRSTYTSKLESSALYWRSFRELLKASVHETARAERMVVGMSKANSMYAQSMQASYDDVFLDDSGTVVTNQKRQQKLLELRSKQKYDVAPRKDKTAIDSSSKERKSHILNSLLESQLVLANKFDHHAKDMGGDLAAELTQLRQNLENRLNSIQKLGDVIIGELERTEEEVAEAWDTYYAMANKVLEEMKSDNQSIDSRGEEQVVENTTDVWVVEMHYRVVVAYQSQAWEKGSAELSKLFASMKETECQRRIDLREYLVAFVQRQEQLFLSLPDVHTPALTDLVGREMDRDKLEENVQASIKKRAQEHAREAAKQRPPPKKLAPGLSNVDETKGNFTLESPLLSDLLCKAKVIEKKGMGMIAQWKTILAVVTADGFLHLFELPADTRVSLGSAPEVAFQALAPRIEVPTQESVKQGKTSYVKGWCDSLTPTESLILANCKISLVRNSAVFDVVETVYNTGASKMFGKTTTKKVTLRTPTKQEAQEWVAALKTQK